MRCLLIASLISLPFSASALAEDKHRQLEAHVHGHGSFNMAIEGEQVSIELEASGADIVGFEHKARTKAQKAQLAAAKKTLKTLGKIVDLPKAAGCDVKKVNVKLHFDSGDDSHGDGKDKRDHAHGHADEKKSKHDHGHGHGHAHQNQDTKKAAKDTSHSEFHAAYTLMCASPDKLTGLSFPYFKTFQGAEKLKVNVVGPKSQKAFDVERGRAKINLGGVI